MFKGTCAMDGYPRQQPGSLTGAKGTTTVTKAPTPNWWTPESVTRSCSGDSTFVEGVVTAKEIEGEGLGWVTGTI